jgi:hypothetical protein
MTKPIYYFAETANLNSLREAEPLKATSLTSAKREARRKQGFVGTWLAIGTSVNSDGFLNSVVTYYSPDDCRWHNYE